jgi:BirA family biotin operon repressor/biotin-[acetyl-CoA-carboxylase] ligase
MPIEINHIHYEKCDSTQTRLEEYLDKYGTDQNILISSLFQSLGRGRQGNSWISVENSIAMSFKINANSVLTLTSLEIGCLVSKFFKSENLKLKWPNDLLTKNGLKCGGILCQNISGLIHVGIGLNIGKSETISSNESYKFGRSSLNQNEYSSHQLETLSKDLYLYILENRIEAQKVIQDWSINCFHTNKNITIEDSSFSISGEFIGIGESGEALIKESNSGQIKKAYSGSLFLN